jgi:predicted esterase
MYVPSGYSPDSPAPLFVALHGYGATSDDWSGYITYAEARGFVLLAPDSRSISWTDADSIAPDVDFIDAALKHTFDRCRIDPTRIAFAGFSDGASYAVSLGVSNGDLFTNLLVHSGGFFWPASPIVGKPPVFQSHGTNDQILSLTLARSIEAQLLSEGYDVTFEEFGGGHELPPAISQASLDWFLGAG